jgi:hypothetical protein
MGVWALVHGFVQCCRYVGRVAGYGRLGYGVDVLMREYARKERVHFVRGSDGAENAVLRDVDKW